MLIFYSLAEINYSIIDTPYFADVIVKIINTKHIVLTRGDCCFLKLGLPDLFSRPLVIVPMPQLFKIQNVFTINVISFS